MLRGMVLEHDIECGLEKCDAAKERVHSGEDVHPEHLRAERQHPEENQVEQQVDHNNADAKTECVGRSGVSPEDGKTEQRDQDAGQYDEHDVIGEGAFL